MMGHPVLIHCVGSKYKRVFRTVQDDFSSPLQLVVTGHSLGAGTASVLAFLLRRLYPDTVCYAYSPPGCVFNAAAAEASRSFVTSVTFGDYFHQ